MIARELLVEKLGNLKLTDEQRNLLAAGFCPECHEPIRGEFEPVPKGWHFIAPEIYETLREKNIDTSSGHKNSCTIKWMRVP